MTKKPTHPFALAFTLLACLLATGCATLNLDSRVGQSATEALALAGQTDNREQAQRFLLRTAADLQQRGDQEGARTVLQSAPLENPTAELARQKRLLAMAGAVALDDAGWARQLTDGLTPDAFTTYPAELYRRAADLQAQTFALAGRPLDSALSLVLLAQTDAKADAQALHDRIWAQLKSVSDRELAKASETALGYESQGWLELAGQLRQSSSDYDEQGRVIRRWQNNWPGHPAAQVLPSELQLIATLATQRPESIVLALPLTGDLGSAGRAIRDGFLAAYYQDTGEDHSKLDIRVVDTGTQPFATLYQELSTQDVDLVVGPLRKEALAGLASQRTLPVPVLGLNYLPEDTQAPDGLYQFGLSAEDEARQIADRMAREGDRQILALIPKGDWGDRVAQALNARLAEDGATALAIERFFPEDNLRAATASLLGIDASRNRAIDVERTIGRNVEFEPRRRQDADAIVLVALPTAARQFNPLFAFYYGGDLPVYAPSTVYEGNPDPARDRDMNGVTFTDIPWILDANKEFRNTVAKALDNTGGQLGRLMAMGADAWRLSKRLPLMRQVPDAQIDGLTGVLTMTNSGRVHREQLWARFRNGVPERLPDLAPEEETAAPAPMPGSGNDAPPMTPGDETSRPAQ
ncbi:penicillin-binding protein activator [Marinobacter sp. C2H3]|uniref:penicillin-binding protein activator n=1 Tax=Marinobacter sp. C2H3 TaxID=3119003 RepID=UPI00300E6F8A